MKYVSLIGCASIVVKPSGCTHDIQQQQQQQPETRHQPSHAKLVDAAQVPYIMLNNSMEGHQLLGYGTLEAGNTLCRTWFHSGQ